MKLEAQRSLRRTIVTLSSILFVPWLALASETTIWVLFAALTVLHFMGNLFLVRAVRLGDLNTNRLDAGMSSVLRCAAGSMTNMTNTVARGGSKHASARNGSSNDVQVQPSMQDTSHALTGSAQEGVLDTQVQGSRNTLQLDNNDDAG